VAQAAEYRWGGSVQTSTWDMIPESMVAPRTGRRSRLLIWGIPKRKVPLSPKCRRNGSILLEPKSREPRPRNGRHEMPIGSTTPSCLLAKTRPDSSSAMAGAAASRIETFVLELLNPSIWLFIEPRGSSTSFFHQALRIKYASGKTWLYLPAAATIRIPGRGEPLAQNTYARSILL
jgi:hypothetical protein